MRADGIAAAIETNARNLLAAWQKDIYGLEQFNRVHYDDPMKAHQFLDDLIYVAEDMGEPFVAITFAEENVAFASLTAEIPAQALSLQHLAQLQYHFGDSVAAESELKSSQKLLFQLDEHDAARLAGEINQAQIEVEQQRFSEADQQLQSVQQRLAQCQAL